MIRTWWAMLPLMLLSSCGIISIEYLPPPPVAAFDSQTDFTKLVFTHSASTYSSNPDFQGYEVYYKIYPTADSLGFTPSELLSNDNSQLVANTPTRDYLITMGYQRMSPFAPDANGTSDRLPLISAPGDGEVITVDFSSFLASMNVANPTTNHSGSPVADIPLIRVGSALNFMVFRTVSNSGVISYPWFSDLYKTFTTATSDMSRTSTTGITAATQEYEVDVFLVAYSFTPEQTIYSQPVPWGVISPLKVSL